MFIDNFEVHSFDDDDNAISNCDPNLAKIQSWKIYL